MGVEIVQTATGGLQTWDDNSGAQGAVEQVIAGAVARGATNTVIIGTLPPNAIIHEIDITVPVVCNAGTTANVSIGLSGGSATYFSSAQDVKTAVGNFSQAPTAHWVSSASAQVLTATYTETGTASSAGTVYYAISYVVN